MIETLEFLYPKGFRIFNAKIVGEPFDGKILKHDQERTYFYSDLRHSYLIDYLMEDLISLIKQQSDVYVWIDTDPKGVIVASDGEIKLKYVKDGTPEDLLLYPEKVETIVLYKI